MQSCVLNIVQCHTTGPYRIHMLRTCRTPWTPLYTSKCLVRGTQSVSCSRLAHCSNVDPLIKTIGRKFANYEPSEWGYFFATYAPPTLEPKEWMEQRIKELKEQAKVMLKSSTSNAELMNFVDTIQRLGIAYHFQNEIEDALIHLRDTKLDNEDDLQHVALRFRLLRQHGFKVSSDLFHKFKGSDGNFDQNLCSDARGLLSLYNAGYLAYPGETLLDEAISFTRGHLKSMVNDLKSPLKSQVLRALKTPLHRMVPRVEAMYYIQEYMKENTRNDILLQLAVVDYNLVQRIYLEELKDLSLWWKEMNLSQNLTYSRDRLVENFFWAVGICFEPHCTRARKMITKYWTMLTLLDDTFDVYGTYEECKILTDAFRRWDEKAIDCLPIYLRNFYLKYINLVDGFQDELEPSEKYRVSYLRKETQKTVDSYMQELEWHAKRQVPTYDERRKPAIDDNAGILLVASTLVGMGEVVTEEALHWLVSIPDIVMASMEICRYNDDAVSYEREIKNLGQGPTAIACYMIEHNLTKDEAALKFEYLADESWKKVNKAFLLPTKAPLELLYRVANVARATSRENLPGFTYSSKLKELVGLLMLKPLSLR